MKDGFPENTVVISTWSAKCNACGHQCDYAEKTHQTIRGYGAKPEDVGCGIEWKYVGTGYAGKHMEEATKACRPDLIYVEWGVEPNGSEEARA
jgi:hypothetical protein